MRNSKMKRRMPELDCLACCKYTLPALTRSVMLNHLDNARKDATAAEH